MDKDKEEKKPVLRVLEGGKPKEEAEERLYMTITDENGVTETFDVTDVPF